jgi:hypothetical protein
MLYRLSRGVDNEMLQRCDGDITLHLTVILRRRLPE